MFYGFVAYIDESGDDGLKRVQPIDANGSSEWLIISAVVVQLSNENAVGRWQRDLLRDLNLTQRRDIHFKDLHPTKKLIAAQRVASHPLRCFVVISNKKNMRGYKNERAQGRSPFPEKNYLYWWLTRLLLERVTAFCAHQSQFRYGRPVPVKIVFSRRGGMSYERLTSYLNHIRFQSYTGELYLTAGDLVWSMIDLGQVLIRNHKDEAGLQFADIVAGAFHKAVFVNGGVCDPQYAMALEPRMYRSRTGKILGNGLKPMPQLPQMNLAVPQREIFEFYGFPKKGW